MRKIFTIVIAIFVCVSIYVGIKFIISYIGASYTIVADSYKESATSGNFAFKITPENLPLVNSYLKVNNLFLDEMSKELTTENSIKNSYILLERFPNFKSYYSAKLKLENAIFKELPLLISNTNSLSDAELDAFFEDNLAYLDTHFGITSLEEFKNILSNVSSLNDESITYCEVISNSIIYNPYGNNTVFRLKVGNNENNYVHFSISAYHGYNTDNQKAPVIIFNAPGGMS